MWEDPIVKETRAAREELLERFNYDLDALCAYLEEVGRQSGKKAVTLQPRRPGDVARGVSWRRDEIVELDRNRKEIVMGKKRAPLKPGTPAPASGQYKTIGPRGAVGPEITAIKGKPLPPGPKAGTTYRITDRTKHKSGR